LAACITHDVEIDAPESPPLLIERLPLTVGVYYSPQLTSGKHFTSGMGHTYSFLSGPPTIAVFNDALSALFERVVQLKSLTPASRGEELAGIITPEITSFSYYVNVDYNYASVGIGYDVVIMSPAGGKIASWSLIAQGIENLAFVQFIGASLAAAAAEDAYRNLAAKLVAEFQQQPEIQQWLTRMKFGGSQSHGHVEQPTDEGAPPP
jgi:hypothetical protein